MWDAFVQVESLWNKIKSFLCWPWIACRYINFSYFPPIQWTGDLIVAIYRQQQSVSCFDGCRKMTSDTCFHQRDKSSPNWGWVYSAVCIIVLAHRWIERQAINSKCLIINNIHVTTITIKIMFNCCLCCKISCRFTLLT